jgi:hypothetical protein
MVIGDLGSIDKLGNDCGLGGMGITGGCKCIERC